MQTQITHIEVTEANRGAEVFGLNDGDLLSVTKVTPNFIFANARNGKEIKISKKTHRACHWANQASSPVFNV